MSFGDRLIRSFVVAAPARRPKQTLAAMEPGERATLGRQRVLPAYVIALCLPVALGAGLIVARDDLRHVVSLLMVLPVLIAAALGGIGPAVLSAIVAGATFDLFHTEPYYRFAIDDSDDVIEMVVLLIVGMLAGAFTHMMRRAVVAAEARRIEVEQLTGFVDAIVHSRDVTDVVREATMALTSLLSLRDCTWQPGYHGTASPVLQIDGHITGAVRGTRPSDLDHDASTMPQVVELPVATGTTEYGRFILHPEQVVTSIEERRAAGTIARLLARSLSSQP